MNIPFKISLAAIAVLVTALFLFACENHMLKTEAVNLNTAITNERNKSSILLSENIACNKELDTQSDKIRQYEQDKHTAEGNLNTDMLVINENNRNRLDNIAVELDELDNAKNMLFRWLE